MEYPLENNTIKISILLWNVEGFKSVLKMETKGILVSDIIILTETFLTEPIVIERYYNVHALAKQKERGRPYGGVTCLYNHRIGKIKSIHTEENIIIISTAHLTIAGQYIPPHASLKDTTEILSIVTNYVETEQNVIIAGDLNCRLDKPDYKTIAVVEMMQGIGFNLINKQDLKTYLAPNGSSAVDIVLIRGKDLKLENQEALSTSQCTSPPLENTCQSKPN